MKPFFFISFIALSCVSSSSWSASDNDKPRQIIADIRALRDAGLELQADFDTSDDDQFNACLQRAKPLRATANALRPRAMTIDDPSTRMYLLLAADSAFVCVWCSDNAPKSCNAVEPDLLRALAADDAAQAHRGQ